MAMHQVHLGIGARGGGGVGCQVAAAVDVGHCKRAGAFVEHVDAELAGNGAAFVVAAEGVADGAAHEVQGDGAADGAALVVAAKDVGEAAAFDVEGHVAGDVGVARAAEDGVDGAGVGAAAEGEFHVAGGGSLVAAAVERYDVLGGASAVGEDVDGFGAADVTELVRAAKDVGDFAGMVVDGGGAVDVGAGVVVGSRGVVVVAGGAVAVTAAEEPLDAATVDDDVGGAVGGAVAHVGCVAAAIDVLDGVVAGVDMHGGLLVGHGQIGCLVAAAEDLVQGKAVVGNIIAAGMGRLVDIHEDVGLRGAVDVVAAEHRAVDGGFAADGAAVVTADVDGHHALDQSCRVGVAQAAAVDVAEHMATLDGHGGGVAGVGTYVGLGAAAVDGGVYRGVGTLHQHGGVATHIGCVAAAEDVAFHDDLCRCFGGSEDKKSAHDYAGAPARQGTKCLFITHSCVFFLHHSSIYLYANPLYTSTYADSSGP